RVVRALALTRPDVLPSAICTVSAPRIETFAAQWLACAPPVNASPRPSRAPAHDSGPMWIATPSSQGTCTLYSLPVSRRFANVFRFAPESEIVADIGGRLKSACWRTSAPPDSPNGEVSMRSLGGDEPRTRR